MFSSDQLRELESEVEQINERYERLMLAFVNRQYKTDEAREHGTHGFARRVGVMRRCIHNVFRILPPSRTSVPEPDDLADASISVQAFVFNVFGSIDNLAWIWVHEKSVVTPKGKQLSRGQVGLSANYPIVRNSLPPTFQLYLTNCEKWLDHLESYRHALAHRIPLYIPPYRVKKENEAHYRDLDRRMDEAVAAHRFDEYERLSAEQLSFCDFFPVMTHSYGEKAKPVVFHPQMIADFKTVEEIALNFVKEL